MQEADPLMSQFTRIFSALVEHTDIDVRTYLYKAVLSVLRFEYAIECN